MKIEGRILFLVFPMFIDIVSSIVGFHRDYCKLQCTIDGKTYKHILCAFKHQTSAGKCTNIQGKMSPEDRMHILAAHNIRRNELLNPDNDPVDPKILRADCMRQFRWSYVLEETAQVYAEQCMELEPYHCAPDYVEGYQVWMNIYEEKANETGLLTNAHNFWASGYDPNADFKADDWKFDYNSKLNSFAAIYNWQTFELGCGRTNYTKDEAEFATLVCLYGPGINDWDPNNPALFHAVDWLVSEGCGAALCQNRYVAGIGENNPPANLWIFLCAAPQDEFAFGYQIIPDPSGPEELEFIAPRSNSSSADTPQLSIFLALSQVFGILNWSDSYHY